MKTTKDESKTLLRGGAAEPWMHLHTILTNLISNFKKSK